MDAQIGTTALLETYGVKERLKCKIVGWSKDEFVVLRAPLTPGIRSRVTEGSHLGVRYLHGGELVGFRAEYITYLVRPYPLLFVSYPHAFETHTLRGTPRLECNLLATLAVAGTSFRGVILDISLGGCRFYFDPENGPLPKLALEAEVSGYFNMLGSTQTHPFRAVVASLDNYKDRGEIGLRFDSDETDLPDGLDDYLGEVAEMLLRLKP